MSLKSRQSLSRQGRLCTLFIGLIVSCQKESPAKEEQQAAVEFKAEIDDETKTYLDGKQVKWKQGDQVTIFNGTKDNQKFQVKDSDDGQTTATLSKVSGSSSGASIDYIVAYYPYDTYAGVASTVGPVCSELLRVRREEDYLELRSGRSSTVLIVCNGIQHRPAVNNDV